MSARVVRGSAVDRRVAIVGVELVQIHVVRAEPAQGGAAARQPLSGRRVAAVTVTPEAVYAATDAGLFAGRRDASAAGRAPVGPGATDTRMPAEMARVEYRGGAIRALV